MKLKSAKKKTTEPVINIIEEDKPDENVKIYLRYKESRSGGEVCAGQEGDRWACHEPTNITFAPVGLFLTKPSRDDSSYYNYEFDEMEIPESYLEQPVLYLAVIRYHDGGTFGSQYGYSHYCGLSKTYTGAEELIKEAKLGSSYKPWEGYFSGLDDEEVYPLHIHV